MNFQIFKLVLEKAEEPEIKLLPSADSGKLPFMAMLRNLRNLLRVGISARHHELVLQRLQHAVRVRGGEPGFSEWLGKVIATVLFENFPFYFLRSFL